MLAPHACGVEGVVRAEVEGGDRRALAAAAAQLVILESRADRPREDVDVGCSRAARVSAESQPGIARMSVVDEDEELAARLRDAVLRAAFRPRG